MFQKLLLLMLFAASFPALAQMKEREFTEKDRAEFQAFCDSDKRAGADKLKEPSEKAKQVSAWMLAQNFGPYLQEVLGSIAAMSPEFKSSELQREATRVGAGRCQVAVDGQQKLEASLRGRCEKAGDESCPSLKAAQKRFAEALPKEK